LITLRQQFVVLALLGNAAVVECDDVVGADDRAEAVRQRTVRRRSDTAAFACASVWVGERRLSSTRSKTASRARAMLTRRHRLLSHTRWARR
jgi:hypothetical protein